MKFIFSVIKRVWFSWQLFWAKWLSRLCVVHTFQYSCRFWWSRTGGLGSTNFRKKLTFIKFLMRSLENNTWLKMPTTQGKKYIDGIAALFLKHIGHRWPEIAAAVYEQMTTLAYANSGSSSTVPGILLAKKIAELAPGSLNRVFFCGGGSEAVEIALKMARQYQFFSGS